MTEKQNLHGVEQYLKDNELAKFAIRYKVHLIVFVAIIILGVIGGAFYSYNKKSSNEKNAVVVYEFEKNTLNPFLEKKIEAAAFQTAFDKMKNEVGNFDGLISTLLKLSDFYITAGDNKAAQDVLEYAASKFAGVSSYASFMIDIRLSTVYENSDQIEKALAVLERMSAAPIKILERKMYLDLGRLYIKTKQNKKAEVSLKFVLKGEITDTFSKMAKIYLEEIAGKTNE